MSRCGRPDGRLNDHGEIAQLPELQAFTAALAPIGAGGSATLHGVVFDVLALGAPLHQEADSPAAALRRHSRHRQSSPSAGIGSFAVSSAHQQSPDSEQPNSAPQREHVTLRIETACNGNSFGFVMICAEASP
ncbi:hypothetical protein JQ632_34310 [Bradyrhizobium liaoningense]|nr:hypothetical protein [Bradyrhizobium liaoningense]